MKRKVFCALLLPVLICLMIYAVKLIRDTKPVDSIPISCNITASRTEPKQTQPITIHPSKWELILVNSKNKIPENYTHELTVLSNGKSVDSRIYPDLQTMFDEMRSVGIYPIVGEGYRTAEEQAQMMNDYYVMYINEGYSENEAKRLAEKYVAKVGHSEHQLGLAVDINADSKRSSDDEVYAWLAENAYKYGFILRYPAGKTSITGIDFEPWHYRYVGKEAALEIFEQGICLEEYVE